MSAHRRELLQALAAYERRGWKVKKTRGGHFKLTSPGGAVVFAAHSASDWRAIKNTKARLERIEREESKR